MRQDILTALLIYAMLSFRWINTLSHNIALFIHVNQIQNVMLQQPDLLCCFGQLIYNNYTDGMHSLKSANTSKWIKQIDL